MSARVKRNDQIAADQALINGVKQFLMQYPSLPIGSQVMTPAAIVQVLQDRITANQAAESANAARATAIKANQDKLVATAGFQQSLRTVVQGMFAKSPDTLAVFGLKPRKASTETPATRVAATAKAKATRAARHTLGPKQKALITGTSTPATPPKPTP